jgi:hypothetical protein
MPAGCDVTLPPLGRVSSKDRAVTIKLAVHCTGVVPIGTSIVGVDFAPSVQPVHAEKL